MLPKIMLFAGLSFLILVSSCNLKKDKLNEALKAELKEIYYQDQEPRAFYMNDLDSLEQVELFKRFNYTEEDKKRPLYKAMKLDRENLVKAKAIIDEYGYPGLSLVGSPENEVIFYVIQHSEEIETYFPIIKSAGEKKELSMHLVAMMEDRLLKRKNSPQKYGTQIHCQKLKLTDEENFCLVWPIENPEMVNERRMAVGFDKTVEENAKRFGVDYKVYTMEEVERIFEKRELESETKKPS